MIDSKKLSDQELDVCCEIMIRGNTQLRALADLTGMEHKAFRARLFKRVFTSSDWPELSEEQIALFVQAIPLIQAVRAIEGKMLSAFTRLARRHANAWAKKMNGAVVDDEDYFQEAMLALLDAIYNYTQIETKFITYAWFVINNRLTTAANKNSPFSPLTNEAMNLLKRYEESRVSLNRYATEEEIFDDCGFTVDERSVIKDARVKVYSQVDHNSTVERQVETRNDYTDFRRGIDQEKDTVPCNYEIREAMERACLTTLERQVVETSLCPHYGWQTELAATLEVSRQTVGDILRRALGKIKKAYLRKKVA